MSICNCGGCSNCLGEQAAVAFLNRKGVQISNAGTVGIGTIKDKIHEAVMEETNDYVTLMQNEVYA
jgi:hypothetical protein